MIEIKNGQIIPSTWGYQKGDEPMRIQLRLLDRPPAFIPTPDPWPEGLKSHSTRKFQVGDCWYAVKGKDGLWYTYADGDYRDPIRSETIAPEHRDKRPIIVVTPGGPNGYPWCIHTRTFSDGKWGPKGWTVTGELPNITLSPSVDMGKTWHGWIKNGVMT